MPLELLPAFSIIFFRHVHRLVDKLTGPTTSGSTFGPIGPGRPRRPFRPFDPCFPDLPLIP